MSPQITTLANGVRVITDAMPHTGLASLNLCVRSGARRETDETSGAAHLLEHMAFKGTERRSAFDIAREIEDAGGDVNAATGFETTCYYARLTEEQVPLGIDILCDVTLHSLIDDDEFAREREVVLQELHQALDTPDDLVFEKMRATAFPDQGLGRSILGTPSSVAALTPSVIRRHMADTHLGGDVVLAAAGRVDHRRIVEAASVLEALPPGRNAEPQEARYVGGRSTHALPISQLHLVRAFEGVAYGSAEFFTAMALAQILGGGMSSRLFQEAREKRGLCYEIFAGLEAYRDKGLFYIYAAATPEQAAALIDLVAGATRGVGEDLEERELDRAKAQMRFGAMAGMELSSARAARLARHATMLDRLIPHEETLASIAAVSVDDVRDLARRLDAEASPTLALVGAEAETMIDRAGV